MSANGLISIQSASSSRETLDRLFRAIAVRGLTVFARIDHAACAATVNMPLRPTVVVIFGNPKGGTALMEDQQTCGIDLPLKALIWEDSDGATWLTYNDPTWIADRHNLGTKSDTR